MTAIWDAEAVTANGDRRHAWPSGRGMVGQKDVLSRRMSLVLQARSGHVVPLMQSMGAGHLLTACWGVWMDDRGMALTGLSRIKRVGTPR